MTATTYKLALWFPGLEDAKPAPLLYTAGTAEMALKQAQAEFPDCKVELRS